MIHRDLSSLNRIIQIYFLQNYQNKKEEKQIVDFLFQCLEEFGINSSILFTHLSNSSEREKAIIRLHKSDYKNKIDFNLINSSLFENSYQLIRRNINMKRYLLIFLLIIPLFCILPSFYFRMNNSIKELDLIKQKFKEEVKKMKNLKMKSNF